MMVTVPALVAQSEKPLLSFTCRLKIYVPPSAMGKDCTGSEAVSLWKIGSPLHSQR